MCKAASRPAVPSPSSPTPPERSRPGASLPILTFEEAQLSPSFGYVFDRKWLDPHESIVSILWKFARMNALAGHLVAAHCANKIIDPYEGVEITRKAIDIRTLCHTLGLPRKIVRGAITPRFRTGRSSVYLRYCSRCLTSGYHSVVHQIEMVQQCPRHGDYLEVACRSCEEPTPYRLNARLLDAPYRCANCRSLLATSHPSFVRRRPMPMKHIVALTRLRLRHYSSSKDISRPWPPHRGGATN
jgi:hypothetical protein